MTAFLDALRAAASRRAAEEIDPARPPSHDAVLAAVLLDHQGVTVEDLMSGTTILVSTVTEVRTGCDELLRHYVYRGVVAPPPGWWSALPVPPRGAIVVRLLEHPHQSAAEWVRQAVDWNCPVVGIAHSVATADVVLLADRAYDLDVWDVQPVADEFVEAVTGSRPGLSDLKDLDLKAVDLLDGVPEGLATATAVAALRRISDAKQTPEEMAKKAAVAAAEVARIARKMHGPDAEVREAERLSEPVGRVVRKLSEMSGFGDAKRWGIDLARDLDDYDQGKLRWSDVDRGILLSGPPGSGKTTFARALAAEAGPGVELCLTTYSDWHGAGGGDSVARNLTKLFDLWRMKAKSHPVIVFIDEIDSIGSRGGNAHNDSWFSPVINAWLAFLDGAVPRDGIVVIAATNHPDRVDPAMLRPGRLDRHITLPMPDVDALAVMLLQHLGEDAQVDDEGLHRAARACRGMSPAQVEQVCREARGVARRIYKRRVCPDDVADILAAHRLQALHHPLAQGAERRIAVHEAGHVVATLAHGSPSQRLAHVDLDARLTYGTQSEVMTRDDVERRLVINLSGLAAEAEVYGDHSNGGGDDLGQATRLACDAQAVWGMGRLGILSPPPGQAWREPAVRDGVAAMLREAHDVARALMRRHRAGLLRVADALQERRYLDAAEAMAAFKGEPAPAKRRPGSERIARIVRHKPPLGDKGTLAFTKRRM